MLTGLPTLSVSAPSDEWIALWQKYSSGCATLIADEVGWNEASIAKEIGAGIPNGCALFVSSSRPIRDFEGFATPRSGLKTYANRGLAGIDGNISTALGIASERNSTIAILGDLSFLHDLTGLIGTSKFNLRILVINNDGGGIFSTLPQAGTLGFEKIFGTPHGQDLGEIAQAMGIVCVTVDNFTDLLDEMLLPISGLSVVIAIVPNRERNAEKLASLNRAIKAF